MTKLVTKTIMTVIKIHVSLNGKIIEVHGTNNFCEGLTGCVRERKMYQSNIKNDTKIHPNIDDKSIQNVYSKK